MLNKKSLCEALSDFYELSTEESFKLFYKELYKLALHTAFYITKNHADAEDIAQQSFLIVFKKINICQSLDEKMDTKIKSWFLSIVYNQSKMHLRQKLRRTLREKITQEKNSIEVQEDSIMEQEQSYVKNKELQEAIENLPEKYRTPIILKYKEGLENQNIAEILHLNHSTLRNRMSRGIQQLKTLLFKNEKEMEELLPSIEFLPLFGLSNQTQPPSFDTKIAIKFKDTKSIFLHQYFTLIISSIMVFAVLASGLFYYKRQTHENPTQMLTKDNKPVKENLPLLLDFTQGSLNNTEIRLGNWSFQEGIRIPEIDKDIYIQFNDLKFKSPCRLQIMGGAVIQSDKNDTIKSVPKSSKRSVDYAIQGTYFGTEGPAYYEEVYFKKRARKYTYLTIENLNKDVIFQKETVTIIFMNQYIITEYLGKISKIIQVEIDLTNFNKLGLILNSFGVKKIEFTPLSTSEQSNYQNKITELIKK